MRKPYPCLAAILSLWQITFGAFALAFSNIRFAISAFCDNNTTAFLFNFLATTNQLIPADIPVFRKSTACSYRAAIAITISIKNFHNRFRALPAVIRQVGIKA